MEKHSTNWSALFADFEALRKPNADAIADLAIDNFYEMRDHTANPIFLRKRQLETKLEQQFKDYFSKYSLVTFREDVPYREAMLQGRAQDEILMSICTENEDISTLDLEEIRARL
jgi:kynurenine 3-monooxygenase